MEKTEQKKVKKKKSSVGQKIFNITFWVIIGALFAVWITDYILVKKEKSPIFCVYKKEHIVDDGKVNECIGLGYKVYKHDRTSTQSTQFGPIFIKMQD